MIIVLSQLFTFSIAVYRMAPKLDLWALKHKCARLQHLKCDRMFNDDFATNLLLSFAVKERMLKIRLHLTELQARVTPFWLTLVGFCATL